MKIKKSILIIGGSGLLALNWALAVRDKYKVTLLLHRRKISLHGVNTDTLALDSLDDCLFVLDKHKPDIVINTAGLTSVEKCEYNSNLAKEINADLAENVSTACSNRSTKLIHISTDHFFSGNQALTSEEGVPEPINNYAKSKLQGEQKVQENCKDALIIRTNFFGWGLKYRQSLSDFIINKLGKNI